MATLTDPVKLFIVTALACFDTPQQVADAVKAEFGLTIDRRQVEEYDPEKRRPSEKWKAIHAATRKRFLDDVSTEPASQKSFRVRRLARMAAVAERSRNYAEARAQYRQIAEEMGGLLTNRRELTGKNGGPIETRDTSTFDELSEAELAALAARIAAGDATAVDGSASGTTGAGA